ncbi:MAG TPA: hypothetical protein VJN71_07375 [Nitrososphaerales archaeon]|nr:hypothetical protein [Nitrososphaerales archaeon]
MKMKAGSFEAIGGECITLRNPIALIPLVSIPCFLLTLYSFLIPSVLEALQSTLWTVIWLGLVLFWILLGVGVFVYGRLTYDSRIRNFEVRYV